MEEIEIEWERKYWEKKKRGLYVVVRFIICIICIVEPFTLVIIPSNSTFNYMAVIILLQLFDTSQLKFLSNKNKFNKKDNKKGKAN